MADWYASSVAYAAVAQWAASHTYAVGNVVRQLAAPTLGNERVFRASSITTGVSGGSEPAWIVTKAGTTADSGVTWTECTGNSAQQQIGGVTNTWTAPHARLENMCAWMADGDRGFASSDHTQTTTVSFRFFTSPGNKSSFFSVDRTTGNIPPLAADITPGAAMATTGGSSTYRVNGGGEVVGFTFTIGTGSDANVSLGVAATDGFYWLKRCSFVLNSSASSGGIIFEQAAITKLRLDDCTVSFGAASQALLLGSGSSGRIIINNLTLAGTLLTYTFQVGSALDLEVHASDFSAMTGSNTLFNGTASVLARMRALNCKLSSSAPVVLMANNIADVCWVEIVNCDSGADGYRNEWHRGIGDITTETTITRTNGATDLVQKVSHKWVTTANPTLVGPLEGPVLSVWNRLVGSSRVATIELQSNATLFNDDIWVELEYLGSASSPESSIISTLPATRLTTHAAIATSTAPWDSSVGSPVYQKLQVTFTPQLVGMVVARIKMAKASQTVYVDPKIVVS